MKSSFNSDNLKVPSELTLLLIDDALRTESASKWLDSLAGLEQESEFESGDDWLETIDEWFKEGDEF